jgi:hypothetical protein
MADEPENLTLRIMRNIDAKSDTVMERLFDLTARVSSLGDQFAAFRTEISGLCSDFVRLEHRMDRFDGWLARIERRLDLIEV